LAEAGKQDLMKLQVAKKTYAFTVARRFSHVKRYGMLKRQHESDENPQFRKMRLFIYKLIGRKEER